MNKAVRISPKGIVFLGQDISGDQYRNKHDKIREQVKKAKKEKIWINFSI